MIGDFVFFLSFSNGWVFRSSEKHAIFIYFIDLSRIVCSYPLSFSICRQTNVRYKIKLIVTINLLISPCLCVTYACICFLPPFLFCVDNLVSFRVCMRLIHEYSHPGGFIWIMNLWWCFRCAVSSEKSMKEKKTKSNKSVHMDDILQVEKR